MKEIKRCSHPSRFILLITMVNFTACVMVGRDRTSSSEPSPIPVTPFDSQAIVTADIAPLRLLPDATSDEMAILIRGNEVRVIGISPDGHWYLVKAPQLQNEAWIAAELITVNTLKPTETATPPPSLVLLDTVTNTLTGTPPILIMTILNGNVSPSLTWTSILNHTPTNMLTGTVSVITATKPPVPIDTPTFTPSGTATLFQIATPTPTIGETFSPVPPLNTPTLAPVDTPTFTPTFASVDTPTFTPTGTPTPAMIRALPNP